MLSILSRPTDFLLAVIALAPLLLLGWQLQRADAAPCNQPYSFADDTQPCGGVPNSTPCGPRSETVCQGIDEEIVNAPAQAFRCIVFNQTPAPTTKCVSNTDNNGVIQKLCYTKYRCEWKAGACVKIEDSKLEVTAATNKNIPC